MSAAKINSADSSRSNSLTIIPNEEIKKTGYLRKLKTMKKKFFVLKKENGNEPARLEYYDSEKKWRMGSQPKRNIILKTCFNINRKLDTKHKHAIALYTKDDCFTIVLENEEELEEWLQALLELQHGEEALARNELPKPSFEHVWQVNIRNRGLASTKNILGPYHLCLTSQTLSLVKLNTDTSEVIEFPLMSIRRCGHSYCFFFMELGRSAVTGAGELWMQTEDVIIAQNMHEAILNAMRSRAKDDVIPRPRLRSCSTNESSKPISVHVRRQASVCGPNVTPMIRERSDSVPTRSQMIGDSQSELCSRPKHHLHLDIQRPHSMYVHPFPSSASSGSSIPSPGSGTNITDSPCSSFSIDDHDPLQFDTFSSHHFHSTTPESGSNILENSITEELPMFEDYLPMTPPDTTKSSISKTNIGADDAYMDMTSPSGLPPSGFSRSRTPSSSNSPNMLGLSNHSNKANISPSQTDYLPMTSVTNSSPELDGYMAMSPVGTSHIEGWMISPTSLKSHFTAGSPTSSGSLHSRKISTEEMHEGYIPMAPLSSSNKSRNEEGYIDMASGNHSVKSCRDDSYLAMSPVSSSVTSGTPSTNIRFSEFQLEKVRAYFTPNEEEDSLVRAYSVGSRLPKSNKTVNNSENEGETSRVRAFSVGSKVGIKFGKYGNNNNQGDSESKGKKSFSAPLLGSSGAFSNSWSGSSVLAQNNKSKKNEDLMELDFAKNRNQSSSKIDCLRKNENNNIDNVNWGNVSAMRPSSNNRSSSSRPSKVDMLHVIGEKSDVKVPIEGGKRNVSEVKRETTYNLQSVDSHKKTSPNAELVKNNKDSLALKAYQELSGVKKEVDSTVNATLSHPLHVQIEIPSNEKQTESPPSSGEYVNIDLSNQYQKQVSSKCLNLYSASSSKGTGKHTSEASNSPTPHDYVNLQVGNLLTSKLSDSSYLSSFPRYKCSFSPNVVEKSSNSTTVSPCRHCIIDNQKQTSASLTSLPSSVNSQAKEEPHKTSSPCSFFSAKMDKSLSSNPPESAQNIAVNHDKDKQTKDVKLHAKGLSFNKNFHRHSAETLYENINFGHSQPRPSSVGSERELNYASLDLAPTSLGDDEIQSSPCSVRSNHSVSGEDNGKRKLSYAKIDFTKSEGLRTTTNSVREIRH